VEQLHRGGARRRLTPGRRPPITGARELARPQRGDGVGGDLVERVGRIGDHGDAVALDRELRDPDAQVDRRKACSLSQRILCTPARVWAHPPSEST
jgi:hypothetical protein